MLLSVPGPYADDLCFEHDGVRVQGDSDMNDEDKKHLSELIRASREFLDAKANE